MRIVIAEDSAMVRAALTEVLTRRGHKVVAAVGDAGALRTAIEQHGPDVAVVDVRMPPGYADEGLRAAIALRRDYPGLGYSCSPSTSRPGTRPTCSVRHLAREPPAWGTCSRTGLRTSANSSTRCTGWRPAAPRWILKVITQLVGASRRADGLRTLTTKRTPGTRAHGRGTLQQCHRRESGESWDRAVEKHVGNIFTKLSLLPSDTNHRRVLAVLRYLEPDRGRLTA